MTKSFDQGMQEATAAHTAGDLVKARRLYEALFSNNAQRVDLKHNLGLVKMLTGSVREGAQLMASAIDADPSNPGMRNSPKLLGIELYKKMFWEDALVWLKRAIQTDPDDRELHAIVQRISAQPYLAPEMYDELEGRTLKRFSPREAPDYIYTIDVAGTCNLRCPSCPVGNTDDKLRVKSMMPVALFKDILSKISNESPSPTAQVRLFNWGEPLLHPQLNELIDIVHSQGFTSHLSSNLNIKPKYLEQAVAANANEFKVSLSGFNQDNYERTHAGGDIEVVKGNLRKMKEWIEQYQATTKVWVNLHRYKDNLGDEQLMANLCNELGFYFSPIDAFYQPLDKLIALAEGDDSVTKEPVFSQLLANPQGHIEYLKQHQIEDYDCELRFNQMVINCDGSVAQCCALYDSSTMLGMQFLDHSHSALESAKYSNPVCTRCRKAGLDFSPTSVFSNPEPKTS